MSSLHCAWCELMCAEGSLSCVICSTGGVVVTSANGLIVCSNTLDERLRIAYNQTLPDIRTALFGAVTRA